MKKLLIIISLFLIQHSLYAQSGTNEGSFDIENLDRLLLRIDTGMKIQIIGDTISDKVSYKYFFEGNAEAYEYFFENFNPTFENRGGEALFLLNFPKQDGKKVNFEIKKHSLVFTIPKDIFLELTTRYSNIEISEIQKGLTVQNRSGLVKVSNIEQSVFIANQYGSIITTNISGDLNISNRSASIDVKDIRGLVTINGEYSKMNISKVNGDMNITNRSGVINAFDIMGSISSKGSYVEYELTNIDGDIKIDNKSGEVIINGGRSLLMRGDYTPVNVSNIRSSKGVDILGRSAKIILDKISGTTKISGQYLEIDLSTILGAIFIENRSGEIAIENAQNNLTINGEFLPIKLRNYKGENLRIINRSNDIEIESVEVIKNIFIETEYGKVDLSLKKKYSGDILIETRYGKFTTNLSIDTREVSESNNEKIISGSVGNGPGMITIKTRNSDVYIDQK